MSGFNRNFVFFALLYCAALVSAPLRAEDTLADVERLEKQAKEQFINRFTEFTKDKNFMGKAKTPEGQNVGGGNKSRFNADDHLPFQSDLTYHDFSYDVREEVKDQQQQQNANGDQEESSKVRKLYGFVSEHGKFSEAGGSSALERKVYELHDRFSKEEEEKAKNGEVEEQEGVKFRSLFKEEIRDLNPDNAQGGANAQNKQAEDPQKVSRWEIRQEVAPEVQKVGENSFETIKKAARDEQNKENEEALGNELLYLAAGNQSLKALYDSTAANLGQRMTNQAIKSGILGAKVELSEGVRDCDKWGQVAANTLQEQESQKQNPDPEDLQRKLEEVQKKVQQCKEVANRSFRSINPKFERPQQGQGGGGGGGGDEEQLVDKGSDKEEGRQRDLRVQLETVSRAGLTAQEVQSNWTYDDNDNRAPVTLSYDQNGNPAQEVMLTVSEQLDYYNKELQSASKNLAEVQAQLPQFKLDPQAPLQYQVQPKQQAAWDVTKIPDAVFQENFGTKQQPQQPAAQTYLELIQQQ